MNQKNIGYVQALWLFIWRMIQNSAVYRILRRIYAALAGAWQRSWIASWFRTVHFQDGCLANSWAGRFFHAPFTFFAFVQRTAGPRLERCVRQSWLISICRVYLHNLLALNTRFIGALMVYFGAAGILTSVFLNAEVYLVNQIVLTAGVLLFFLDVNITGLLRGSLFVRLIEKCLDTGFSFAFYDEAQTQGRQRVFYALPFGVAAGVLSALAGPLYGALLLAAFAGLFLILYKVEAGLFITVFLTPLVPTMAVVGLSLLCLVSLLLRAVTDPDFRWRFDGMGLLILGLLAVYLVAGLSSFAMAKSLSIWCVYFAIMVFYFIVINTIRDKKQLFDLLTVFALSGALVCLYGVAQYLFGWNINQAWMDEQMFGDIRMRIYSTLENPNVLGEYILLVLPVCIGLMWVKRGAPAKLVYAAIATVAAAALILTSSRGCWIGSMVAAAVFVTFAAGKLWGLVLLILPFVPMFLPESIINRFASIGDMGDSSTSYRVYIWMGTLNMLKDFWLSSIGMGSEAFTAVYPFYSYNAVVAPHSHNLFLQILVEAGVVGIVVFLAVLFLFYKNLAVGHAAGGGKGKPIPTMIAAIGAGVAGFLVQGMFDNCFYNYRVVMVFWTVLALGMACVYLARRTRGEEGQVRAE